MQNVLSLASLHGCDIRSSICPISVFSVTSWKSCVIGMCSGVPVKYLFIKKYKKRFKDECVVHLHPFAHPAIYTNTACLFVSMSYPWYHLLREAMLATAHFMMEQLLAMDINIWNVSRAIWRKKRVNVRFRRTIQGSELVRYVFWQGSHWICEQCRSVILAAEYGIVIHASQSSQSFLRKLMLLLYPFYKFIVKFWIALNLKW